MMGSSSKRADSEAIFTDPLHERTSLLSHQVLDV
jgi:hypothetical protein